MAWWDAPQYDKFRAGPYPSVEARAPREHELLRADDDTWTCRCDAWSMPRRPHQRRTTGDNHREAELSWMTHRDSFPMVVDGGLRTDWRASPGDA